MLLYTSHDVIILLGHLLTQHLDKTKLSASELLVTFGILYCKRMLECRRKLRKNDVNDPSPFTLTIEPQQGKSVYELLTV